MPNSVQIGILGVVGAGLLATAIASAGDAVARAYVVANTVETQKPNAAVKPARQVAGDVVAEALGKLAPAKPLGQGDGKGLVPLPIQLEVSVDGNDNYRAIAVRQLDGKELEYLAGPPRHALDWYASSKVKRAVVPTAAEQPQIVALPSPVQVTVGRANDRYAIMVKLIKGEPSDFLIGGPGEAYEWRPAHQVKPR